MQSRKETAWKKNRKLGDVKGGRTQPKITDNIFARAHSLQRPAPGTELPVFISDNPSRDFFFPVSEQEIRRELSHLPRKDWTGITHIGFRRFKKTDYAKGELPLAQFSAAQVCASLFRPHGLHAKSGGKGHGVCKTDFRNALPAALLQRW